MDRQPPLVKVLARLPGTKESRYAHLLSGDVEAWEPELAPASTPSSGTASADSERIARLEAEVAGLQEEIASLKQQIADFHKQSE